MKHKLHPPEIYWINISVNIKWPKCNSYTISMFADCCQIIENRNISDATNENVLVQQLTPYKENIFDNTMSNSHREQTSRCWNWNELHMVSCKLCNYFRREKLFRLESIADSSRSTFENKMLISRSFSLTWLV